MSKKQGPAKSFWAPSTSTKPRRSAQPVKRPANKPAWNARFFEKEEGMPMVQRFDELRALRLDGTHDHAGRRVAPKQDPGDDASLPHTNASRHLKKKSSPIRARLHGRHGVKTVIASTASSAATPHQKQIPRKHLRKEGPSMPRRRQQVAVSAAVPVVGASSRHVKKEGGQNGLPMSSRVPSQRQADAMAQHVQRMRASAPKSNAEPRFEHNQQSQQQKQRQGKYSTNRAGSGNRGKSHRGNRVVNGDHSADQSRLHEAIHRALARGTPGALRLRNDRQQRQQQRQQHNAQGLQTQAQAPDKELDRPPIVLQHQQREQNQPASLRSGGFSDGLHVRPDNAAVQDRRHKQREVFLAPPTKRTSASHGKGITAKPLRDDSTLPRHIPHEEFSRSRKALFPTAPADMGKDGNEDAPAAERAGTVRHSGDTEGVVVAYPRGVPQEQVLQRLLATVLDSAPPNSRNEHITSIAEGKDGPSTDANTKKAQQRPITVGTHPAVPSKSHTSDAPKASAHLPETDASQARAVYDSSSCNARDEPNGRLHGRKSQHQQHQARSAGESGNRTESVCAAVELERFLLSAITEIDDVLLGRDRIHGSCADAIPGYSGSGRSTQHQQMSNSRNRSSGNGADNHEVDALLTEAFSPRRDEQSQVHTNLAGNQAQGAMAQARTKLAPPTSQLNGYIDSDKLLEELVREFSSDLSLPSRGAISVSKELPAKAKSAPSGEVLFTRGLVSYDGSSRDVQCDVPCLNNRRDAFSETQPCPPYPTNPRRCSGRVFFNQYRTLFPHTTTVSHWRDRVARMHAYRRRVGNLSYTPPAALLDAASRIVLDEQIRHVAAEAERVMGEAASAIVAVEVGVDDAQVTRVEAAKRYEAIRQRMAREQQAGKQVMAENGARKHEPTESAPAIHGDGIVPESSSVRVHPSSAASKHTDNKYALTKSESPIVRETSRTLKFLRLLVEEEKARVELSPRTERVEPHQVIADGRESMKQELSPAHQPSVVVVPEGSVSESPIREEKGELKEGFVVSQVEGHAAADSTRDFDPTYNDDDFDDDFDDDDDDDNDDDDMGTRDVLASRGLPGVMTVDDLLGSTSSSSISTAVSAQGLRSAAEEPGAEESTRANSVTSSEEDATTPRRSTLTRREQPANRDFMTIDDLESASTSTTASTRGPARAGDSFARISATVDDSFGNDFESESFGDDFEDDDGDVDSDDDGDSDVKTDIVASDSIYTDSD